MSWFRSDSYKAVINSHWLTTGSFWFFIIFYCVKLIVACMAFFVWRRDFKQLHQHTDFCRPVVPPFY